MELSRSLSGLADRRDQPRRPGELLTDMVAPLGWMKCRAAGPTARTARKAP